MEYKLRTQVPIRVTIQGNESYAVISWIGEYDKNLCEGGKDNTVPFSTTVWVGALPCKADGRTVNGSIPYYSWGGRDASDDVSYIITQKANDNCECDPDKVMSGHTHEYGIVSSVTVPYFVEPSSTATTVFVTYYDKFLNECGDDRYFTGVTTASVVFDEATCDDYGMHSGSVTVLSGRTVNYNFYHTRPSSCDCREDGEYIEYGQPVYDPAVVPYSSGDVTVKVTIPFVKIVVKDCVESMSAGVSGDTVIVHPNETCSAITFYPYGEPSSGCSIEPSDSSGEGGVQNFSVRRSSEAWDSGIPDMHGIKVMYNEEVCGDQDCEYGIKYIVKLLSILDDDGKDVQCDCSPQTECTKECSISPADGEGSGGEVNFTVNCSEGDRDAIPYYGGIAYANIEYSAVTVCPSGTSIGNDVIELDVPAVDPGDCRKDGYDCVPFIITYKENQGAFSEDDSNVISACVAQSVDCEEDTGDCDTDIFEINTPNVLIPCVSAETIFLSGLKINNCIKLISAESSAEWLPIFDIRETLNKVVGVSASTNEESDRTATIDITYEFNGEEKSKSMTVTQKKCPKNCNCGNMIDDLEVPRETPIDENKYTRNGKVYVLPNITELDYSGYTDDYTDLWHYHVDGDCDYEHCVSANGESSDAMEFKYPDGIGSTQVDDFTNTENYYLKAQAKVEDNENPTEDRTFVMALTFDGDCDSACTKSGRMEGIEIVQKAFDCDCEKIWFTEDGPTIGAGGGDVRVYFGVYIGKYNEEGEPICIKYGRVTADCNYGTVGTIGYDGEYAYVDVTVDSNDDEEDRQVEIDISNRGSDEEEHYCFTINCTQEAAPVECNCSLIDLNINHSVIDEPFSSAATAITAATYTDPPASEGGEGGCTGSVEVSSSAPWLSVNASNGNITCSWGASNDNRTATVTVSLEGETCGTFSITQGIPCPNYTITPSDGEGTGGIVTFTVNQ